MVETKKSEVRYRTTDPDRMLNRYTARRVLKTWTETIIDKSTGKTKEIERNELLLEKGTLITSDVLASIRFWQEEGSLAGKEIEVSNQRRLSFVNKNTCLYPYKASAEINGKKWTFLMYATSVANALEILTDYIELNFEGGFTVSDVKELEYAIVLIDSLKKPHKKRLETEIDYINGNDISTKTDEDEDDEDDIDANLKLKFYQIQSRIVSLDAEAYESEQTGAFIVQTFTAARANLLIDKWLHDRMEERRREAQKNPDFTYEIKQMKSYIEESKTIPIGRFIPVEFSNVYRDEYSSTDS